MNTDRNEVRQTVTDWLDSGAMQKMAARVAVCLRFDRDQIDDLLQDVALALLRLGPTTLVNSTYVYKTALHKAVDVLRIRAREGVVRFPRSDPQTELRSLLRARVASQPLAVQTLFRLRYEEGHTVPEVCESLQLTRGSIRGLEDRLQKAL